jgi:cobalamin biosynthesis Mg chelatase CobN
MDTQELQMMDEQADEAVAKWSLGALMVNMLPPPFDRRAMRRAIVEISEDLCEIYRMEKDRQVFKDMAGTIVRDLRQACEAEPEVSQTKLDPLKYIPGVNVWVALMMQPHTVEAVAHSVSEVFKHYFHAQMQNLPIEPEKITELATESCRETLRRSSRSEAANINAQSKRV